MTYLDYNATAPVRPEVRQAMLDAMRAPGNASSIHHYGRTARKLLEDARAKLAKLVDANPADIVFTASATEANHLALQGLPRGTRVLASAVEHLSVLKQPIDPQIIPVDGNGVVDLGALEALLAASDQPTVVSVMIANNEIGTIQPLAEVVTLAKRYGALVHSDAVQAVGRLPLSFAELGLDLMSLGFHKCGGPVGVGALVMRPGLTLTPYLCGGGHERQLRAGTHNIPAIAGLGALMDRLLSEGEVERQQQLVLQQRLERGLQAFGAAVTIMAAKAPRLPNTCCVGIANVAADQQLIKLDMAGVAVSSGSACSSGKVGASRVLQAMNIAPALLQSTIRLSWGWATTAADIDALLQAYQQLLPKMGDKVGDKAAASALAQTDTRQIPLAI